MNQRYQTLRRLFFPFTIIFVPSVSPSGFLRRIRLEWLKVYFQTSSRQPIKRITEQILNSQSVKISQDSWWYIQGVPVAWQLKVNTSGLSLVSIGERNLPLTGISNREMFCNLCSPDMVSKPAEIKTAYKINQTKYHQVNTLMLSFNGTVKSLRKHC